MTVVAFGTPRSFLGQDFLHKTKESLSAAGKVALPILARSALFFGAIALSPLLASHITLLGGAALFLAKGFTFALAIELDTRAGAFLKKHLHPELVQEEEVLKSKKRKLLEVTLKTVFRTALFFGMLAVCPLAASMLKRALRLPSVASESIASGLAFSSAFSIHNKAMSLGSQNDSLSLEERRERHSRKFLARAALFAAAVALGGLVPGSSLIQSAGQGSAFAVAAEGDAKFTARTNASFYRELREA